MTDRAKEIAERMKKERDRRKKELEEKPAPEPQPPMKGKGEPEHLKEEPEPVVPQGIQVEPVEVAWTLHGITPFSKANSEVNTPSTAQYIYAMLDATDKKIIMMLTLPYIREKVMTDGKLDPEKMRDVIDPCYTASIWVRRIRWLCDIGAILDEKGKWIIHPNVAQSVSQKA